MLRYIILALVLLHFGFMVTDGLRGLIKGDYFRPKSGAYQGQLGPWSIFVKKAGLEPESVTMKLLFVVLGVSGLATGIAFFVGIPWGFKGLVMMNVLTIWYLVSGTVIASLQLILLYLYFRNT